MRHLQVCALTIIVALVVSTSCHDAADRASAGSRGTTPIWTTTALYSTAGNDTLLVVPYTVAVFTRDSALVIGSGPELVSISPDGGAPRRLGRDGDGPGEYRGIQRLGIADDGTLLVSEYRGRITHLTEDGGLLGITPRLESGSSRRELDVIAWLDSGRIVATWWQQRPNRGDIEGLPSGDLERDPVPLLLYDTTGREIDSLGLWRGLERARVLAGSRLPVPFARFVAYDARGSTIAVGPTDSLDVSLFEGTTLRNRFTAPAPHQRPTAEERAASSAAILQEYGSPAIVTALESAPQVEAMPAVGALVVDDRRNVWVGAYVPPGGRERLWTIYSPSGTALGRLTLPAAPEALVPGRSEILDVYGDRIAFLREGEDGELSVEVLRYSQPAP